jgi:hypothetical protein
MTAGTAASRLAVLLTALAIVKPCQRAARPYKTAGHQPPKNVERSGTNVPAGSFRGVSGARDDKL